MKSRRVLDSAAARQMVAIREARRAARRGAVSVAAPGTPADTSAAAQAVQDALWRRASASEKLMQVARLSAAVEQLSVAGLRQRDPGASEADVFYRRAEERLGPELAACVYRAGPDGA